MPERLWLARRSTGTNNRTLAIRFDLLGSSRRKSAGVLFVALAATPGMTAVDDQRHVEKCTRKRTPIQLPNNMFIINHLMAEASGSRTHLRHGVPHAGFEDQAQHRPRLASSVILTPGTSSACRRCSRLCSRQAQVRGALLHGFDAEFDVLIQIHIQSGCAIHNVIAAH